MLLRLAAAYNLFTSINDSTNDLTTKEQIDKALSEVPKKNKWTTALNTNDLWQSMDLNVEKLIPYWNYAIGFNE